MRRLLSFEVNRYISYIVELLCSPIEGPHKHVQYVFLYMSISCPPFHIVQIKTTIDSSWTFMPYAPSRFYGKSQMTSLMAEKDGGGRERDREKEREWRGGV